MNTARLESFATWLQPLIEGLEPSARAAVAREIGQTLRQSQQTRIRAQVAPDGTPYTPRRPLREKAQGRGKGGMFQRLRLAKNLKVDASAAGVLVAFVARVQAVAQVHQYGLRARVRPSSPVLTNYPARPLLGFSVDDEARIKQVILDRLLRLDGPRV